MSVPVLTLEELLLWADESARNWFAFLASKPTVQRLPCGIYRTETVLGLVRHIVAAEERYGQRLTGESVTPYEAIPEGSLEALVALHEGALGRIRRFLADPGQEWEAEVEVVTLTAGTLRATRRKILAHALVHGIRHWAQLATLVRNEGFPTPFPGDLLVSAALS